MPDKQINSFKGCYLSVKSNTERVRFHRSISPFLTAVCSMLILSVFVVEIIFLHLKFVFIWGSAVWGITHHGAPVEVRVQLVEVVFSPGTVDVTNRLIK